MKKGHGGNHRYRKYIDIILDETARLERLVQQVRQFAEIQSATLCRDNLETVIHELLNIFQPMARNQNITFSPDVHLDRPYFTIDSFQLILALSNIIENAMESMPNGGTLEFKVNQDNDGLKCVTLRLPFDLLIYPKALHITTIRPFRL